jgi:hypothetical protein
VRLTIVGLLSLAVLLVTAACGAEVVHASGPIGVVDTPTADQFTPASSDGAAGGAGTNVQGGGDRLNCVTQVNVFDIGRMLRPEQILPDVAQQGAGQTALMYALNPLQCPSSDFVAPQCEEGFPWGDSGTAEIGSILGSIGVTSMEQAVTGYDESDETITETVLTLTGQAHDLLEQFAETCADSWVDRGAATIYSTHHPNGIAELVEIQDRVAVGVAFSGSDLNTIQQSQVLNRAIAQLPPP